MRQSPHYKIRDGKMTRIFDGTEWDNFTPADKVLFEEYYLKHCPDDCKQLYFNIHKAPDDIRQKLVEADLRNKKTKTKEVEDV
jgi:hypothetical protein